MERIIIIGCCGSGKSTLARKLGRATALPVVHLDQLYWQAGWQCVSDAEFHTLLSAELEKPLWIIDGDYAGTLPLRLEQCDTAIFLDFPRLLCLLRVLRRVLGNCGRVRSDMAAGCPEKLDFEFLKWVWDWRKNRRSGILACLDRAPQVHKIILKSPHQVNRFLAEIEKGVCLLQKGNKETSDQRDGAECTNVGTEESTTNHILWQYRTIR